MEDEIAEIIVKVLAAFQDSIPTADKLKEWSQLRVQNQSPDDESLDESLDDDFDEIVTDVDEIVTKFRRKTQDEIGVMLVKMNDTQREHYQRKAENAEFAVKYYDLALHHGSAGVPDTQNA